MNSIYNLVRRDDSTPQSSLTPLMINLLIALLVLVLVGLLLVITLLVIRSIRRKRQQQSEIPYHNSPQASKKYNHRRLTITAAPYGRRSQSVFVYNEKQAFLDQSSSPPPSPVPEIRITFPEEEDKSGKRKSGRVVVVRIGENGGVGLEPYQEECLPPYQSGESDRFQSLDLERMGGLREKEHGKQWS
ncbi:hypothetical protein MMC19_000551 [Ptychographa xylographoides]|nr:hypothetical protein [Ptychographa xylographoides]